MNDPYSDQAKVLASLSAENGLLRAEADVGRLSARIVAIRRALEGK